MDSKKNIVGDLNIRKASREDALLLFKWANNSEVRKNAINRQPILWENHTKWFENRIKNPLFEVFILSHLNEPIGQIRYERKELYWEIDYSISQPYRGKGFGKYLVKNTMCFFKGEWVKGTVRSENIPSSCIFEKLEFQKSECYSKNEGSFVDYIKFIS